MDTRASRCAVWKLHATPSREADINPNPKKGGYPAPDRVTFLTGPNRDFPKRRRQGRLLGARDFRLADPVELECDSEQDAIAKADMMARPIATDIELRTARYVVVLHEAGAE